MSGPPRLSGVPETMLLTLYHRAAETARPDRLFRDDFAVRFLEGIDHDVAPFDDWRMRWVVPVRTWLIDAVVRGFLERRPDATVVTVGAGLCARSLRLDNGRAHWWSVDLDVVRPYWHDLIGDSARNRFVAGSVTDSAWLEQIVAEAGTGAVLVVAEGVLHYLPVAQAQGVVRSLRDALPGAELVLDVVGPVTLKFAGRNPALAATGSTYRWAVADCAELTSWAADVDLLGQWYLIDYCPDRQRHLAELPRLFGGKGALEKVAHLRLGVSAPAPAGG